MAVPPPPKPGGYPGILRDTRSQWPAGRVSFQPSRHVPCQLEGLPSSRRGTCTSLTGRASFQPARYVYLANWKETFPAGEDVPCRPVKRRVSKDTHLDTCPQLRMRLPPEKAAGYPDVTGPALVLDCFLQETLPESGLRLMLSRPQKYLCGCQH
jgi:hypothetical protein